MRKPCLDCGTPSTSSRCPEHRRKHRAEQVGPAAARGYDAAWNRLSKKARAMSPLCELCASTEDLQLDHLPEAWIRKAAGKVIRLQDVRVLCRLCNVGAGSSRPNVTEAPAGSQKAAQAHGRGTDDDGRRLRRKAPGPLHTEDGSG